MTVKLSTALRNKLAGSVASRVDAASKIAFVLTGSLITDANSALLTDGFRPGDTIVVTDTASNDGTYTIASIAADGSQMVTNEALADESVGGNPTITGQGKSLKEIFNGAVLHIYSGSAPSTADLVESGVLLLVITEDSLAFTIGSLTNALLFDAVSSGTLSMDAAQTWSGVGLADGTAGYYRLYDNEGLTGATALSIRLQGTVGTSGADMNVSTTAIVTSGNSTVTQFDLTVRAS